MHDVTGTEPSDLEHGVLSGGATTAADVLALRRRVYSDGVLRPEEAEILFRLQQSDRPKDPAWADLYVEALTDYYFWSRGEDASIDDQEAEQLIARITADDRIDEATELRLLLNVHFRCKACSQTLQDFLLDAVRRSVLESTQAIDGKGAREPGVVDDHDVEILRRLVYGRGGDAGMAISRREAELLLDLDAATDPDRNARSWSDLLAKAVTMHLLFSGASPDKVDEPEARWLAERVEAHGGVSHALRALLSYVRQEATDIHPVLDACMRRHGV
jgi:hypothetical protein